MSKYYYVTNGDGTTFDGFRPFGKDPDYAEAPDWVPDDRECGQALHVVAGNPAIALTCVPRTDPVAHEVEPIDARPERGHKIRCRALRRVRTLSAEELRAFCIEAVRQNGYALNYMPAALRDREMCIEAVRQNGYALSRVPAALRDECLMIRSKP